MVFTPLQVNGPITGRELLSGRAYERQFTVCYKKIKRLSLTNIFILLQFR